MRNPIEIDYSHSRAILQEIGERLRTSLKEDPELPASLRLQIDRLRQLEGQSQPNVAKPTTRDSSSKRLDSATCAQVCRRQVRRPAPSAYAPVREGTPISGG